MHYTYHIIFSTRSSNVQWPAYQLVFSSHFNVSQCSILSYVVLPWYFWLFKSSSHWSQWKKAASLPLQSTSVESNHHDIEIGILDTRHAIYVCQLCISTLHQILPMMNSFNFWSPGIALLPFFAAREIFFLKFVPILLFFNENKW